MTLKLFIAGTDTNVGKTYISAGILSAFNAQSWSTLGIKPIASGGNEDTLIHQQTASIKLPQHEITAFAFEPPIAPHLAAQFIGRTLSVKQLNLQSRHALQHPADVSVIEGCGGWYVPLNSTETMADFVIANQLNVILVVGVRLGCINHSLLTFRAMQQDKVNILGWIANCIDPHMKNKNENIATLKEWLPIPCLGVVEHGMRPETVIDVRKIVECVSLEC